MRGRGRISSAIVACFAATCLGAPAASSGTTRGAVEPLLPLRGTTLAGPTHLRLIVAGAPPYVYDVDRDVVSPFAAVRDPESTVDLVPYGAGALATVRARAGRSSSLILTASGTHRRASAADARSARNASLRFAVARGPGQNLTFVDRSNRTRRAIRWPSILGDLDGVRIEPDGPYIAIGFADPAYPGPQQAEDVFLLDRRTGSLTHIPGFPAQMRLKFSSMAWTSDGRLVLLVRDGGVRIGIYRPGDARVALRRVDLPPESGGSDQFVLVVEQP